MSAFSEPSHARRRRAKPWPVVRRKIDLMIAHRAAQGLREHVLAQTWDAGFKSADDYPAMCWEFHSPYESPEENRP